MAMMEAFLILSAAKNQVSSNEKVCLVLHQFGCSRVSHDKFTHG
jgi:hypothetical protein